MIDKNKITQNFNRADYDLVAGVQKSSATKLINGLITKLPEFYPDSILDIGTGTGYVTKQLFNLFPDSSYSLNDISPNMLELAQKNLNHFPRLNFILSDMENTDFAKHQLIISNMSLQWANNLNNLIRKLYNSCDVLAFSCLLDGTFGEWSEMFKQSGILTPMHKYPTSFELESYLLSLNPTEYFFDIADYNLEFENSELFIQYLRSLGANYSTQKISLASLRKILKNYNQKFTITYKVFFAIIS